MIDPNYSSPGQIAFWIVFMALLLVALADVVLWKVDVNRHPPPDRRPGFPDAPYTIVFFGAMIASIPAASAAA